MERTTSRQLFWTVAVFAIAGCQGGSTMPAEVGVETRVPADTSGRDRAGGDRAAGSAEAGWYWGGSTATENEALAFMGYNQGCAVFGDLNAAGSGVSFQVGYRLLEPVADRLKHHEGFGGASPMDDGPLTGYSVVGTMLLLEAVKQVGLGEWSSTPLTSLHRFADPRATSASGALLEGTLPVAGGNPCAGGDIVCRARVDPTIIVVWQESTTRVRAYQFIRPNVVSEGALDRPRFADCPTTSAGAGGGAFHQAVGVYWPLREDRARRLDGAPEPIRWTDWIDELLPR